MRHALRALVCLVVLLTTIGCVQRRSSVLMERSARGPVAVERELAQQFAFELAPPSVTMEHDGVEMTASFASPSYLHTYFQNRAIFGSDAGLNPYFPENLVLYVRIANRTAGRIKIDPNDCVLLDNLNNQYQSLPQDTITALAEYRAPIATFTRSTLREARPGYFGVSVPAGGFMAGFVGNPQQRLALLKQVTINQGILYPGVVYDGFIAFWTPHRAAKTLRLVWPVKADINANDQPQKLVDFELPFTVERSDAPSQANTKTKEAAREAGPAAP